MIDFLLRHGMSQLSDIFAKKKEMEHHHPIKMEFTIYEKIKFFKMKLLRFFKMTIGTDENRLSDSKVYASIIQHRDQEVQCFSHKIAISKDRKKVLNQQEIIFTIPAENHQEFFKELVIDPTHKCIWGITNFKSYKVFKNNSITEFNTTNYQKNID